MDLSHCAGGDGPLELGKGSLDKFCGDVAELSHYQFGKVKLKLARRQYIDRLSRLNDKRLSNAHMDIVGEHFLVAGLHNCYPNVSFALCKPLNEKDVGAVAGKVTVVAWTSNLF